jgi:5-methylcytosine-specific restriction endonuclease McrA
MLKARDSPLKRKQNGAAVVNKRAARSELTARLFLRFLPPRQVTKIWQKTQSREHPEHAECLYCGDLLGGWDHRLTRWQIDHYVALEKGGPDTLANVFAACIQCNSDKSDLTVEQFLASPKFAQHTHATLRRTQHRARRCMHMVDNDTRLCSSRGPCKFHR